MDGTHRGRVFGIVDIPYVDYLYGGAFFDGVAGTVTLTVDFANRTLAGRSELTLAERYHAEVVIPLTASLQGVISFSGLFVTRFRRLPSSETIIAFRSPLPC
jgi:hypothetical protein